MTSRDIQNIIKSHYNQDEDNVTPYTEAEIQQLVDNIMTDVMVIINNLSHINF